MPWKQFGMNLEKLLPFFSPPLLLRVGVGQKTTRVAIANVHQLYLPELPQLQKKQGHFKMKQ